MNRSEILTRLLDFVVRSFMVDEADIELDESLIDQGVIDSFGLVEITAFIEKDFGVLVRESDMTREQFGSMNKMATFVHTRLQEADNG